MTDDLVPIEYVARGVDHDPAEPWAAGDEFDGYTPVEPYAYRPRPSSRSWTIHPHQMPIPDGLESARVVEQFYCDCSKRTTLVRTLACSDGRVWALVQPERIPAAARGPGHDDATDTWAIPMHCDANGTPHIQVTTCKRCGRNWLVLLWDDCVELVKVDLVRHRLRVAPDRTP